MPTDNQDKKSQDRIWRVFTNIPVSYVAFTVLLVQARDTHGSLNNQSELILPFLQRSFNIGKFGWKKIDTSMWIEKWNIQLER